MKKHFPDLHFLLALLLATQAWAWLRILGSFWVSGSLTAEYIDLLFMSVMALKIGLSAFIVTLLPAWILNNLIKDKSSTKRRIIIAAIFGAIFSIVYVLDIVNWSLINQPFIVQHGPVIVVAGVLAGLIFHGASEFSFDNLMQSLFENSDVDRDRRTIVTSTAVLAGGSSIVASLIGPTRIWLNSDKHVDVDLSRLNYDGFLTVDINGLPVWIFKRPPEVIEQLRQDPGNLYDPDSVLSKQPEAMRNVYRSLKPEYFIAYSVCTHLGCVLAYRPEGMPEHPSGFYANKAVLHCPCHNGMFDMAGRVFKGTPPPQNLKVPDYEFISETTVRIYYPSLAEKWG